MAQDHAVGDSLTEGSNARTHQGPAHQLASHQLGSVLRARRHGAIDSDQAPLGDQGAREQRPGWALVREREAAVTM